MTLPRSVPLPFILNFALSHNFLGRERAKLGQGRPAGAQLIIDRERDPLVWQTETRSD